MPKYYDIHVRFSFKNYRELGFAGVCRLGEEIEEAYDINLRKKDKINILTSPDVSTIKKGIKMGRFDIFFLSTFSSNIEILRLAKERGSVFEIPIKPLIESVGTARAELISKIRFFLKLCNKYSVSYVITSRAECEYEIKTPRELITIGEILGLEHEQAIRAISAIPENIIGEKNATNLA